MLSYPIAVMLTRIRNAVRIERAHVDMPYSKVKRGLAEVLKREGFIWDWAQVEAQPVDQLRLELKYGPNGEQVRGSPKGKEIQEGCQNLQTDMGAARTGRQTTSPKATGRRTQGRPTNICKIPSYESCCREDFRG